MGVDVKFVLREGVRGAARAVEEAPDAMRATEIQEAEIAATGIPLPNDRESTILTLSPDAYTAIARGAPAAAKWRWWNPATCNRWRGGA
jgi:hypothetical protein